MTFCGPTFPVVARVIVTTASGGRPARDHTAFWRLRAGPTFRRSLRKRGFHSLCARKRCRCCSRSLARPGQVVSREELRARLWPDGTFVDFDWRARSSKSMSELRSVLGDSASGSPRFIETLSRRGYRFLATVAPVPAPASTERITPRSHAAIACTPAAISESTDRARSRREHRLLRAGREP